jgi:hypothetical protein
MSCWTHFFLPSRHAARRRHPSSLTFNPVLDSLRFHEIDEPGTPAALMVLMFRHPQISSVLDATLDSEIASTNSKLCSAFGLLPEISHSDDRGHTNLGQGTMPVVGFLSY